MAKITNDIAPYQPSTKKYIVSLYKDGSRSITVKLTEGNWCLNRSAGMQIYNAYHVFGNVSVYHYLDGYSSASAQAQYFIHWIKRMGLDKSTVWALDVEDPSLPWNCDSKINVFIHYMTSHGYKSGKVVYGSASWFKDDRINRKAINTNKIWIAAYDASEPGVNDTSVWQYTDNFKRLSTDASLDFNYTFVPVPKPKHVIIKHKSVHKPTNSYWHRTGMYQVISDIGICSDPRLRHSDELTLDKGSTFKVTSVVSVGKKVTRLKTDVGYISGNTKYVRPIK